MIKRIPETRDLFFPVEPYAVNLEGVPGTVIGRDLGAEIVVLDGGGVIAARGAGLWEINRSLAQYRDSLAAVGAARDRPAISDADVDALEALLREIDAESWAEPFSYWAAVVEQMRDELF